MRWSFSTEAAQQLVLRIDSAHRDQFWVKKQLTCPKDRGVLGARAWTSAGLRTSKEPDGAQVHGSW